MNTTLGKHYIYNGTKNYVKMSNESVSARDEFLAKIEEKKALEPQDCFVCSSKSFEPIGEIDRYGFYYPTGMCTQCGNVQQTEYYNESVLVDFYSNYYRKIYGNTSSSELFKSQKEFTGKKIYKFITSLRNPRNVLEIGCGAGGILAVFKENGSAVTGLDFDDDYLEEARSHQIRVIRGSTEALDRDVKFDVIILSHLLEHIVKPADFLNNVKSFLTDDGLIYIEVPSIDGVCDGAFHYDLLRYWQNAHTIHFTTKSLDLLCLSVGLENVSRTKFIESCWKKSDEQGGFSQKDQLLNLEYTKSLLKETERRRKSWKNRRNKLKTIAVVTIKRFIKKLLCTFSL